MGQPFLGQIMTVGFNFAPQGWYLCAGQTLSISQNTALFSLLGTYYGGNGTSTFQLPNLNGRMAVGTGQLAGGSTYVLGQIAGTENVTLTLPQLPSHTHAAAFSGAGSSFSASSSVHATSVVPLATGTLGRTVDISTAGSAKPAIYTPAGTTTDTALAGLNVAGTVTVSPAGSNSPVPVLSPYLALTMIIAATGIFPTRS